MSEQQTRTRPPYRYRVVSSNGAGIYGREYPSLGRARQAARRCAETLADLGPFEVERVLHLPGGSQRYWMLHGKRWKFWDGAKDADVRKPAFIVGKERNRA